MNKKILSLGLVITLSTGLIIGCNKKEDKEETTKEVYIIQYVDDEGNVIKEKSATKVKKEDEEVKEETKKEETKKKAEDKKESKDIKKETTKEEPKEDKKNDEDDEVKWDKDRCPACHKLLENCTCQTEYCAECGKEIDDCICNGDAPTICEDCGNTLDNCTCDQSWDENTCPACLRPTDECICK